MHHPNGHQALWRRYDLHLREVSGQEYLQGIAYALVVIDYEYLAVFHDQSIDLVPKSATSESFLYGSNTLHQIIKRKGGFLVDEAASHLVVVRPVSILH